MAGTAALLVATGTPISVAASTGCVPVAIMALRGSGEQPLAPQTYKSQTSNGAEGPTLQRLLRAYTYSPDHTPLLEGAPIVGLSGTDGYKAVAVDKGKEIGAEFATDSPVWNSANDGAIAAIRKMGAFQREQPGTCPRTRWVLVGYSQGAMVARFTYEVMGPAWIASLYLVGDPFQKGSAAGTRGAGAIGNGVFRLNYPGMRARFDHYYAVKPITATSYCHAFDVICDFPGPTAPHENYFKAPAEAAAEGGLLARIVAAVSTTPPVTPRRDAEVMFAIDTTGSMGTYIDNARSSAQQLAQQVLANTPQSRVGLVEYRDHGDDFVARTVVPLTRDTTAFQSGLDGLVADGGGDTPESVYSGIYEAASAGWAAGSARSIAVIGDAPAHDPEDVTGYTAATTIARLQSIGTAVAARSARTSSRSATATDGSTGTPRVFGLSDDSDLSAQLEAVSSVVGGQVYSIGSDGSVADLMGQVVAETAAAPLVTLTSGESIEGSTTVLSATASEAVAPGATYDFDLDGDGTYETTGTDPIQAIDLGVGTHRFGVRVTGADGRVATATTTVETLPRTVLAPPSTKVTGLRVLTTQPVSGAPVSVRISPTSDTTYVVQVFRGATQVVRSAPGVGPSLRVTPPASTPPGKYVLRVVASDGSAASVPLQLRQRPTLAATASRGPGRKTLVTVTAKATGTVPTGKVVALLGRKQVGTARLTIGRAVITVRRSVPRSARVTVRYLATTNYVGVSTIARRR